MRVVLKVEFFQRGEERLSVIVLPYADVAVPGKPLAQVDISTDEPPLDEEGLVLIGSDLHLQGRPVHIPPLEESLDELKRERRLRSKGLLRAKRGALDHLDGGLQVRDGHSETLI